MPETKTRAPLPIKEIKDILLRSFALLFRGINKGNLVLWVNTGTGMHKTPGTDDNCYNMCGILNDDVLVQASVNGDLISGSAKGIATCNKCGNNNIILETSLGKNLL